jgi:hypothetical protein
MFKVTALPFDGTPRTEDGKVNYKEDFGKKPTDGFRTTRRRNFCHFGSVILLDQHLEAKLKYFSSPC